MTKKKNNFYVVWLGYNPGIYNSWDECKEQIFGFAGAKYKGFSTIEEAKEAYSQGFENFIQSKNKTINLASIPQEICICVDAACSGNPGIMEYQGVWCQDKQLIFKEGPFKNATNNIGEFLAIVHGLSWLKKNNLPFPLYSDSAIAIKWIKQGKVNSKLQQDSENNKLFQLIFRAEKWLKENPYYNEVRKWDTNAWGEIPADFGRK